MIIALLLLPLLGLFWPKRHVLITSATLAVAVVMAALFDYSRPADWQMTVDVSWVPAISMRLQLGVDGVSLPLVVLTALLTTLCAVYSQNKPRGFVALLALLETGMLGTFVARDLLLFFVFLELVLLPMYALIAGWGGPNRVAAARMFILYTLLGSGLLLVGLLVIYVNTGTLDMAVLAQRHGAGLSHTAQLVAFVAIALGLGIKAPMWPLHSWLPAAHTEAPTVGSVLLAGVLLKMGTYGLVRIAVPILPQGASALAPVLGACGVVGIVYAGLACLAQRDLKRLIAYSSVGHMGFVLLGIATLTSGGINAALFGNIAHGVITGLLFFVVGGIKERYGTTDLSKLGGGLLAAAPRLGSLLVVGSVASLGVPGLAGFWGEMLSLQAAYAPALGLPRGLYLVFLGIAGAGTVLTATYFLVMVRRVAYGQTSLKLPDLARHELVAWTPLVVLLLVVGLWPRALLGLTDPAVRMLLRSG
jgi:NADH-quinone oxidoreductase subunit M